MIAKYVSRRHLIWQYDLMYVRHTLECNNYPPPHTYTYARGKVLCGTKIARF